MTPDLRASWWRRIDADAFDVHPARRRPRRRHAPRPEARRAGARARPLVHAAHLDERDRPAGQPPRGRRRRRRAVHRVPVRPARLDPGATRLHARRAGPARTPTGFSASRRGPGSGSPSTRSPCAGSRHDPTSESLDHGDWIARARGARSRGPRRSSTAGSCRRHRAGPSATSPAGTARPIADVAEGGAEDVDRAVAAARARRSTIAAGRTSRRTTASASCSASPS